jgi:hypothetical protein
MEDIPLFSIFFVRLPVIIIYPWHISSLPSASFKVSWRRLHGASSS